MPPIPNLLSVQRHFIKWRWDLGTLHRKRAVFELVSWSKAGADVMITIFGDFRWQKIGVFNRKHFMIIFAVKEAVCNFSKNRQFFSPIISAKIF
jgi:hypothetical protein